MGVASVRLDPAFAVGPLNRRIFGAFVEHMGRCVYGGIYEPDHPTADEHGFRGDVARPRPRARAAVVRYPGGNFVSGYHWEDGVGPGRTAPRGSTSPGSRSRPTRSAPTSSWPGPEAPASSRCSPSTSAPAA